jgi:hypothetical protein
MTDTSRTIERDGDFADLFIDAEPPTSDDVSITRNGVRLDSEEKIRSFFASVDLIEQ